MIPFDPVRKRALVVIRPHKESKYVRVVLKGAPEFVIPYCTKIMSLDGEEEILKLDDRERLLKERIIDQFCAQRGLKAIVYAYRDIDVDDWDFMKDQKQNFVDKKDRLLIEKDFVFLAAFGLSDELRPGVREAVSRLEQGGIQVRMVSGDNLHTAI
mmetsp:Transcript_9193/g.6951  ORF Transcript_9193/g.6951 Transcript_9193/m.6951 type:complete len:156 (-) Transcript_9193:960-1427(-)